MSFQYLSCPLVHTIMAALHVFVAVLCALGAQSERSRFEDTALELEAMSSEEDARSEQDINGTLGLEIMSGAATGVSACVTAWRAAGARYVTESDIEYVEERGGCKCVCKSHKCYTCSEGTASIKADGTKQCLVTQSQSTTERLPPVTCADNEEAINMDDKLVCQKEEDVCPAWTTPSSSIVEYRKLDDPEAKCYCRRQAFCVGSNGVLTQSVGGWYCPDRVGQIQTTRKVNSVCMSGSAPWGSGTDAGCALPTECMPVVEVPPEIACGPLEQQNVHGYLTRLTGLLAESNAQLRSCLVTCETVFSKMDECYTNGRLCTGSAADARTLQRKLRKIRGRTVVKANQARPCGSVYKSNMALTTQYQHQLLAWVDGMRGQGKNVKISGNVGGRAQVLSVERWFESNVFGSITCGRDGKSGWCPNAFSGRDTRSHPVWGIEQCQNKCRTQHSLVEVDEEDAEETKMEEAGKRKDDMRTSDPTTAEHSAVEHSADRREAEGHGGRESGTDRAAGSMLQANTSDAYASAVSGARVPNVCAGKYSGAAVKGQRQGDTCTCRCVGADCKKCPEGYVEEGEECVKYRDMSVSLYVDTPITPVCPTHWTSEEREDGQLVCVADGACEQQASTKIGNYARIAKAEMVGECGCAYQVVCNTGVLTKTPGGWVCRDTSQSTETLELERIAKPCAGLESGEEVDPNTGECYVSVGCPPDVKLNLGPLACGPRTDGYLNKYLNEALHVMVQNPSKSECLGRCWAIHSKVAECVNEDLSQYDCTGIAYGISKASEAFDSDPGLLKKALKKGRNPSQWFTSRRNTFKTSWPNIPAEFDDAVGKLSTAETTMLNSREANKWMRTLTSKRGSCRNFFSSGDTRMAATMQEQAKHIIKTVSSEADFQLQVVRLQSNNQKINGHTAVNDVFGFSCDGDCKSVLERSSRSADVGSCIAQCLRI